MMLPESLLDISKYEKYDDNNIYISAVEMRLRWQEYNEYLQIAIDELSSGNWNANTRTKLIDLTESISLYLMELDDMICKAEEVQFNVPYEKDKLCKDFKELTISHFIVWIGRHFFLNANLGHLYSVVTDDDYMFSSFCDDYSIDNDIFLSELLKRKDREPLENIPLTIKTYLLRTDVDEVIENLKAVHCAFECEEKSELSQEEQRCVKFKQNLDEIYGESCADFLDDLYTKGSIKFNDIIGYDIFTKICDLKQEFNRQINASSAVIFVVGDKTALRTAGSACKRSGNDQGSCNCTPYKQNTNGTKPCKVFFTSTPGENDDVGCINSYSYLKHEFKQAEKKNKTIIVVYNSLRKESGWLPSYMKNYEDSARPFWTTNYRGDKVGDYAYIKEVLGF